MLNLKEIHKPATLAEALKQLQQPGTVALAGGTQLITSGAQEASAAVDLSALGLAYIRESHGAIVIGATTTLAELAESPILQAIASGVVAQAAHRSAASVLRNQETLAGTLIAEPDAVLAVALLALDAQVALAGQNARTVSLADFLAGRESLLVHTLLTEISLPMTNPRASLHTVARTPSDKPIVSVCAAARVANGLVQGVRIALGGVGETALRAKVSEQVLEGQVLSDALLEQAAQAAAQGLTPRGDFRGSVEYRKEMAAVLTRRAVKELAA